MMRRFIAFGSFCAALTASGYALAGEEDPWFGPDKFLHFGASAVLAGGGYAGSTLVLEEPWQRAVTGAAFSLTVGGAKELYDLAGGRDASYRDLVWDAAGTAVGVAVALIIDLSLRADSEPGADAGTAGLSLTF